MRGGATRCPVRLLVSSANSPQIHIKIPLKPLDDSARVGQNEELFPHILDLHVPQGSVVADVTYGKGIFWKRVPVGAYRLLATDIETGVDCRQLTLKLASIADPIKMGL